MFRIPPDLLVAFLPSAVFYKLESHFLVFFTFISQSYCILNQSYFKIEIIKCALSIFNLVLLVADWERSRNQRLHGEAQYSDPGRPGIRPKEGTVRYHFRRLIFS